MPFFDKMTTFSSLQDLFYSFLQFLCCLFNIIGRKQGADHCNACLLYTSNKLPYYLFQQIDSLFGFSCCPWAPLPPASLDFLCFLSGQLDFIGNHQQCHGDLPDLNRWSTVLAVFSFIPPCTESSAFPFMILKHPHIKISTDQ